MHFFLSRVLLCTIVFALGACATNQQVTDNRLTLPAVVQPEEGVMLVKLVGLQPVSAFNPKWKTIKVTHKKTGRITELQDTALLLTGYSLFMGTLPEGEYEVSGLESLGPGPGIWGVIPAMIIMGMTSDHQSLQSRLGSFEVKRQTVTNLGLIVSALPKEKGQAMQVAVLADAQGQAAALSSADRTAQERLRAMPVIGWKDGDTAAGAQPVATMRRLATNILSVDFASDQRVLIGSALGMVHVRSPDGRWTSTSVGAMDNINFIRGLNDGSIFAGTDSGRYFLWQPKLNAWRQFPLPDSDASVISLEEAADKGVAIASKTMHLPSFSRPPRVKLHFTPRLNESAAMNQLLDVEGFSAMGAAPLSYIGGEIQFVFNHTGFSRSADLYRFDATTLAKRADKLDYWASDIYRVGDGKIVMSRVNGLSTYLSLSDDEGKTWRHGQTSLSPYWPRLVTPTKGYGFQLLSIGWSSSVLALAKTEDGGQTWSATGEPVAGEGLMAVRRVGDHLLIRTPRALLSTRDEGKSWKVEWPLDERLDLPAKRP